MRRAHLSVLALVAACSLSEPCSAGGFRQVFEDEFDGTSLDRARWATRYVYADGTLARLNDELQSYDDANNHVVENGSLSLIARHSGDGKEKYRSGMIRSRRTFYFGYFEARVFLPNARGVWPAFWLNSDYDEDGKLSWPPEIDAFEYVINGTNETPDMIHSAVKVGKSGAQGGQSRYRDPEFNAKWNFFRAPKPLNTDWQVIGLLWKPDSVSMYLNGRKLYTTEYRWVYDDGKIAGPAHVLFNLAVGGAWAGLNGVEDAKFPQALKIDYVRVCQYDPALTSGERCGNSGFSPTADEAAYRSQLNDLPRSRLVSVSLSKQTAAAGDSVVVKYAFDAVPSPSDHSLRTALVDVNGAEVASVARRPRVPTSRWRGAQEVSQSLALPRKLPPGRYRVLVSLGSDSGPGAPPRRISLSAPERFGAPDGRLRYTVGEVVVSAPKTESR